MAEPEDVVGDYEDWARWGISGWNDIGSRTERRTAREDENRIRKLDDGEVPQIPSVDRMASDTQ